MLLCSFHFECEVDRFLLFPVLQVSTVRVWPSHGPSPRQLEGRSAAQRSSLTAWMGSFCCPQCATEMAHCVCA